MGTYNQTSLSMECPRCRQIGTLVVDMHFGYTSEMEDIEVGGLYPFFERRQPQNGGVPASDEIEGGGYAECPHCTRDFFCDAKVDRSNREHRDGRLLRLPLIAVVPSSSVPPYGADREDSALTPCPACGSSETRHQTFERMKIGRLICDSSDCMQMWVTRLSEDGDSYQTDDGWCVSAG